MNGTHLDLSKKTVLVVGLARTGEAVARFCLERGARVIGTDLRPGSELEGRAEKLAAAGVVLELGGHHRGSFETADLVVVSPGVPWNLPVLRVARTAGVTVWPEIELAARFCQGTLLAVTGTNGKSTTTALLAEVLRADGRKALAGGNLGTPFVAMLAEDGPDTHHVVECSSFQLEGIAAFRPQVAVLTNLAPDHVDRHGTLENYREAKARLFVNQTGEDFAVVNAEDREVQRAAARSRALRVDFSHNREIPGGVFLREGWIVSEVGGERVEVVRAGEIPIPGQHNVENVCAAVAAAMALGADPVRIRQGVLGFQALEHRLQRVAEGRGITFYNDSKATNLDSTLRALESFPGGIHVLLGGRDKGADWSGLRAILRERARAAYLIGEAAGTIEKAIAGALPIHRCATLEEAVQRAWGAAVAGDVVLLAPGCASFDMFRDYEDRGRRFTEVARVLVAGGACGGGGVAC